MAYDKNFTVRKNAYEAEMKAYSEIENACAACLNGIKGEVITFGLLFSKVLYEKYIENKSAVVKLYVSFFRWVGKWVLEPWQRS